MELGDGDSRTAGELALSRGWAAVERLSGGQYPPAAAARLRAYGRAQLALAAARLPGDARVMQGLASKALAEPVKKTAKGRTKAYATAEDAMAVTRSWAAAAPAMMAQPTPRAAGGMVWLAAASVLVAAGIAMAYAGKAQAFAGAERLVNVNTVGSAEELEPLAGTAAPELFAFLERKRPLANIGALAPLRRSAGLPLARLKPSMAVRTPGEFRMGVSAIGGAVLRGILSGGAGLEAGGGSAATARCCRRCTCWRAWGSS